MTQRRKPQPPGPPLGGDNAIPPDSAFKKTRKDGSANTCKFCHKPVWWHCIEARWYDEGGKTLHVRELPTGAGALQARGVQSHRGTAMQPATVTYRTHAVFVGYRLAAAPLLAVTAGWVASSMRDRGFENVSVVDLSKLRNTDGRVYMPITTVEYAD